MLQGMAQVREDTILKLTETLFLRYVDARIAKCDLASDFLPTDPVVELVVDRCAKTADRIVSAAITTIQSFYRRDARVLDYEKTDIGRAEKDDQGS